MTSPLTETPEHFADAFANLSLPTAYVPQVCSITDGVASSERSAVACLPTGPHMAAPFVSGKKLSKWRSPFLAALATAYSLPHSSPSLATAGLIRILRMWTRTESCAWALAGRRGCGTADLDLRGKRIGMSACSAAWTGNIRCREITRPMGQKMDRVERVERIGQQKSSPISKCDRNETGRGPATGRWIARLPVTESRLVGDVGCCIWAS